MATVNGAHSDNVNQQYSIIGVIGTLGTSDTKGTALTLPVSVDAATGALNAVIVSGGAGGGGSNVNVFTGTQQTLGTVGVLNAGTLNALASGTITGGTLQNLVSGTLGVVTAVTTVSNLTNGSVNILTGTLQSSGTTTGVGVVSLLSAGTITAVNSVVAGTQNTLGTVGVINNLVTGTLAAVTAVTTVSNLTNGSVNILTGTVTSVTNVAGGTFQRSSVPVQLGTPLATVGTTAAAVWGTLVAASGAGTKQYVSRTSIVVTSGTVDIAITNIGIGGSVGAGVLERGQFPAGGGITNSYDPVMVSGTNGTLAYWLGGAGTVAITVNYWQGV